MKHVFAITPNTITLNFMWYDDKSTDDPLHGRYWICSDEENEEHHGLTLCSVDSLGKKESSITEIESDRVLSALLSYSRYVFIRPKKILGRELKFDGMELD